MLLLGFLPPSEQFVDRKQSQLRETAGIFFAAYALLKRPVVMVRAAISWPCSE